MFDLLFCISYYSALEVALKRLFACEQALGERKKLSTATRSARPRLLWACSFRRFPVSPYNPIE